MIIINLRTVMLRISARALNLGGRLFEAGRSFEAKILGRFFDNPVSRAGAYSRGCLFEGVLNRGITVFDIYSQSILVMSARHNILPRFAIVNYSLFSMNLTIYNAVLY